MKHNKKIVKIILCGFILLFGIMQLSADVHSKAATIHFNPTLGDVSRNIMALEALIEEAFENGAKIIVGPEIATTGYCITREEVLGGYGTTAPYPELDGIKNLAITYAGYVVIGIAEVVPGEETTAVYNSGIVFGPEGFIKTQDKRTLPLWHDPGTLPLAVIPTPYGDLGILICSDSWRPSWTTILTLKGADIIALPANWWGDAGQVETWQIRAKENDLWFLVANRWGIEVDTRFGEPYSTYDMSDAASVIIDPDGNILQQYRACDATAPSDTILYQMIAVPKQRINSTVNNSYSITNRRPTAYGEIANLYYRRDLGYEPVPGLPPAGPVNVAVLSYTPSAGAAENLAVIRSIWDTRTEEAEILLLPGMGITVLPVFSDNPQWYDLPVWNQLSDFAADNNLSLLATTVLEISQSCLYESLLIIQPGSAPVLNRQIHDLKIMKGTGSPPLVMDLPDCRVGFLTGHDALFPEISTQLAKSGIDLLLIPSTAGVPSSSKLDKIPGFWDIEFLKKMWQVTTNNCFHTAASDWTGNGKIINNGSYYTIGVEETNSVHPLGILTLDTATVRRKYLDAYFSYDLDMILSR